MSTWEYLNGAFDCTSTPLGTIGCKIIIHATSNKRKSWDQRGREGFSVGPVLQHYRCIQAIESKTMALIITDTAEYLHECLTQLHVTEEYRMIHDIHFLFAALKDVPTSMCNSQLAAIEAVQTIFANWRTLQSLPPKSHTVSPHSHHSYQGRQWRQYGTLHPAITYKGVVQQQQKKLLPIPKNTQVAINSKGDQEPIAKRTISSINSANPPTIQSIQTLNELISTRTMSRTVSQKYSDK